MPPPVAVNVVSAVHRSLCRIFAPLIACLSVSVAPYSRCVDGTGNAALCNVTQEFYCGMEAMDEYVHNENGRAQCNCPPQCFNTVYDVTSSQAVYSDYYLDFMAWVFPLQCHFFTALHWMQGGVVTRKLFVCLSVCQMRALWQNERKICPDFYTIRKIT